MVVFYEQCQDPMQIMNPNSSGGMNMLKRITAVCVGLAFAGSLACVDGVDDEPDEEVHEQGINLVTNVDTSSDVTHMKYTITPVECPNNVNPSKKDKGEKQKPIVAKKSLKDMTLPGGIPTFENKPFDENSKHQFADYLKMLPVGCYDVDVQPMRSKKKASKDCQPVSQQGVEVTKGKTTEILLVSQCKGDHTGLLDVIAALNHPPTLVDFEIIPNKFVECPKKGKYVPVKVCARATDPEGDPMVMKWDQLKGPAVKDFKVKHSVQVKDTLTECVTAKLRAVKEGEKQHQFKVTVYDQFHNKHSELITAEQWYKDNSFGKVKSRVTQKFPIYVSCVEKPKKKRACPLNKKHWKSHHKYASMPKDIAWPTSHYTSKPAEKTKMCGKTWLNNLHTKPKGDAFYTLSHQYIAAHLNIANGAKVPPAVALALFISAGIVHKCPTLKSGHVRYLALTMAAILEKYNDGLKTSKKCKEFPYGDDKKDGDDNNLL